jgi:DNA-binding YbaB/EbfC family protein
MKGGLGNIMKQAQAMQENMRKMQEELARVEVTGSAGGGMVTIIMTCRHDVRRVTIDPALLKDDKEVLEDLIAAAMNDAVRKAEQATQEKMASITAGLNLPGGLGLPF